MHLLKKVLGFTAATALIVPAVVFAQDGVTLINPLGDGVTDPRVIVGRVISSLLSIIGTLTLLMFVYGGLMWITSMGNDKMVAKGKLILVWTTAGLAIIAGAYVLSAAVIKALTTGSAV